MISKGLIMIIIACIGIIVSIVLFISLHLRFKKKEKEMLKKIEVE